MPEIIAERGVLQLRHNLYFAALRELAQACMQLNDKPEEMHQLKSDPGEGGNFVKEGVCFCQ